MTMPNMRLFGMSDAAGSIQFDGTGYLRTTTGTTATDFGPGLFTVECWFMINGDSVVNGDGFRSASLFSQGENDANRFEFTIKGNATTTGTAFSLYTAVGGGKEILWNTSISKNTWHHVAFVRTTNLGTPICYFNGTVLTITSSTLTNDPISNAPASAINIGRLGYTGAGGYLHNLVGRIFNLRTVKGTAVYTGNFSILPIPLTAIANTTLLICQRPNLFKDNSTSNLLFTRSGGVSTSNLKPF